MLEDEARQLTADENWAKRDVDTIFGKITRGEIPTDFLYEDEVRVIRIYPQAPTHVLIIPRKPISMLSLANADDQHCCAICFGWPAKSLTS